MPIDFNFSMRDFREMQKRNLQQLEEWERERTVKKCPKCRQNFYSYGNDENDPGACVKCRGLE